ncbi:MAG: hypothetical protein AAFQ14_17425 [Cyanobacteria bacterium J06621_12]
MPTNSQANQRDRNWNAKKFIQLSDNLGEAYGLGVKDSKSCQKADFWTVDKFISMSRHLSSAYGVDM